MNSDRILQFKAIADTGSITEAANKLYITQPAISKSLTLLEKELNCKLFDRVGRRLVLNSQGRKLLKYADQIQSVLQNIENDFYQNSIRELKICGVAGVFSFILENYFRSGIKPIRLSIVRDEDVPGLLFGREIDIAITDDRYLSENDSDLLKRIPLLSEQLLLSVPVDHELSSRRTIDISEVTDLEMMRMTDITSVNNWVDRILSINSVKINWTVHLDGDSYWNLTRSKAVAPPFFDSSGMHLSSDEISRTDRQYRKLLKVTGVYTQRMLFLYYIKDNLDVITDFIDCVKEMFCL